MFTEIEFQLHSFDFFFFSLLDVICDVTEQFVVSTDPPPICTRLIYNGRGEKKTAVTFSFPRLKTETQQWPS